MLKLGTFHLNKQLLFVLCLVLLISGMGIALKSMPMNSPSASENRSELNVGIQSLQIEVANTPETITKGLGYRDIVGSDGMLFVLGRKEVPSFWMKGMRFDLDFVWIDTDHVADITEHVPAQPGASDAQLLIYRPKVPVTHVLELTAGEIAKRGIRLGDPVVFPQDLNP